MLLLAAKTTFVVSKLQKYMSLVNETWSRDVPPQHLPLAVKMRVAVKGWGEGLEGRVEGV